MKAILENEVNATEDQGIFLAVQNSFQPNDTVETFWVRIKKLSFKNHIFGRGANHIWIKNIADLNKRIVLITS